VVENHSRAARERDPPGRPAVSDRELDVVGRCELELLHLAEPSAEDRVPARLQLEPLYGALEDESPAVDRGGRRGDGRLELVEARGGGHRTILPQARPRISEHRTVKTIEAEQTTPAPREAVWALLEDPARWAEWGSWSTVEVDGGGPQGVGVERTLVRWPYRVRERITEWEPRERHSYELLEGMNVRSYRSTVTLEDAPGGGTTIRWRSEYDRAGPLTALVLRAAVRDSCKRVAKAASEAAA
jgi:uncharacterized protein YndB with AHSA1/START domain